MGGPLVIGSFPEYPKWRSTLQSIMAGLRVRDHMNNRAIGDTS